MLDAKQHNRLSERAGKDGERERDRAGGAGKSESARDGENIRGLKKQKKQCSQFTPRGEEQGEVILIKINN